MNTAARPRLKHSFIALILALVVGALFIPLASSPAYAVENDGSKAQLQAQSLTVNTNAITAVPSNDLSMYQVYSDYLDFNPGWFSFSGYVCMAIRPADSPTWDFWGNWSSRDTKSIRGLRPNTNYEAMLYYKRYNGETGNYSNPVYFKTGSGKMPKPKSVKVTAVKVKKHYQKVFGYVIYWGKVPYWTYKIKTTVTFKKKPNTPYIWINGKQFKGNKKTYTVTTAKRSTYYKPRGKKHQVIIYTLNNPTYGGYSNLYQKNHKIK